MEGLESHHNEIYQNRKQGDTLRGVKGKQEGARGLLRRDFQKPQQTSGGRREALQGRLRPAKAKITTETQEMQEKKTELHRKQRKGKKGPAGQGFQAIKNNPSETYENENQQMCNGKEAGRRGRQGGLKRGHTEPIRLLEEPPVCKHFPGNVFLSRFRPPPRRFPSKTDFRAKFLAGGCFRSKKRVSLNFGTAGSRIRWWVPSLFCRRLGG